MNHVGEALCAALREDTSQLPALTQDDWRAVAALAIQQRVGALLLSRPGLPFPDAVRAQLRARAEFSAKRGLMLHAAARELVEAAAASQLTVVLLKGLHLSASIYPSAGLREMGDIDVLVPVGELEAAATMARSLGYAPDATLGVAHHHMPPMVRGRISVEIHWTLFPDETGHLADPEGLISRAIPWRLAATGRTLSTEDLLLHICAHAAGHHVFDNGLRPLCDVQAILRRAGDTLDWNAVIERAHLWKMERSLGLMLALTRDYLGVTVPPAVEARLSAVMPSPALCQDAMHFLFDHVGHLKGTSEAARQLLEVQGTTARLRHVATALVRHTTSRPGSSADPAAGRLRRLRSAATRAVELSRRHGGWLWRASRDRQDPLYEAIERRNALAEWIRGR
jgi:hypothetical protein